MKTIKIIILLCIVWALPGCSKFLEEVSNDEIIPESAQDLSEFLYGEAYLRNTKVIHPYLDIITDDVKEQSKAGTPNIFSPDLRITGFGYYAWQQIPEYQTTGALNSDKSWETYYHLILTCNLVLKNIDEVAGSESLKSQVKGEAYMIRAQSYFMLVNLYGQPYNETTANTDLGVPLNDLYYMEDQKFERASVAAVYEQIAEDVEKGIEAFEQSTEKKSIFRWNIDAAKVFTSRVYLYIKQYDKVIQYTTEALNVRPLLYDLNAKSSNADDKALYFLNSNNPEILFSYNSPGNDYNAVGLGCFPASDELIAMYSNDWRYGTSDGAFIRQKGSFLSGKAILHYKSSSLSDVYGSAIRSAEAYLNRAEAYAEQGKKDLAMDDINAIRKARIKVNFYEDLSADTEQEAIAYVRDERRRELCFEQHRWFDLRRWDRPRLTHTYNLSFNPTVTVTYVLEKDDPAYTLPIPKTIIDYEPDLKNNPRPERNPSNL